MKWSLDLGKHFGNDWNFESKVSLSKQEDCSTLGQFSILEKILNTYQQNHNVIHCSNQKINFYGPYIYLRI